MGRDGQEPGGELPARQVGAQAGVGAHEGLLGRILRIGPVAEHAVGQVVDRALVPLGQGRERRLVAGERAGHQGVVAQLLGRFAGATQSHRHHSTHDRPPRQWSAPLPD